MTILWHDFDTETTPKGGPQSDISGHTRQHPNPTYLATPDHIPIRHIWPHQTTSQSDISGHTRPQPNHHMMPTLALL